MAYWSTAEAARSLETTPLPDDLWDLDLNGISREGREKLRQWRPGTLGQASRIAGITPADVAVLLVHLRRRREGVALEIGISR